MPPRPGPDRPVVTFDVFSALVDSRRGASAFLGAWAGARGWPCTGAAVYDAWDAENKRLHRDVEEWVPFAALAERALATTYADLALAGDPGSDAAALLDSMAEWPLWPDVEQGVGEVAAHLRVGLLSNIDDDLLSRTRVRDLPVEPAAVVTSQRVRAYKPGARLYGEAGRLLGRFVHVASSARDVRGALDAGLPVVRLRRPGHVLDPQGQVPRREVDSTLGLAPVLLEALQESAS